MSAEDYFSPDYATARERFRDKAARAGASLHEIPLTATGPHGDALIIDLAWLGAPDPARVLLHTSGLHGVEAYTGSAAQLALLDAPPALASEDALVLVHVLNPYGMAWVRRTNENNVDLNRNFLGEGERFEGAPALYRKLDPLLNPPSPPARDFFALRAALAVARHGFQRVKQAVAEGQYEYPRGLFFGGQNLEQGPRLYTEWLARRLDGAQYVLALDLHTGLGRYGTDTVVPESFAMSTPRSVLGAALGRAFVDSGKPSVAYSVRGGYGAALPRILPDARIDFVLQEIGTRPPLAVIHALREENRWHFFGDGSIVHPAKRRLLDALCPAPLEWRRKAIDLACGLARSAAAFAFRQTR